eukprot:4184964-Karenia_brevis.AAC.1
MWSCWPFLWSGQQQVETKQSQEQKSKTGPDIPGKSKYTIKKVVFALECKTGPDIPGQSEQTTKK